MFSEYSASEMRELLIQLFPYRKLVLSQFTFFNHEGVVQPTGKTSRRGRRCYRLHDILGIACILALKEVGIPLKNIQGVPAILQSNAERILAGTERARLSGYGTSVSLSFGDTAASSEQIDRLLDGGLERLLFWSYDVSALAAQLQQVAAGNIEGVQVAA